MTPTDQATILLHARLPVHQRRVERSRAIVAEALAQNDLWHIALSGGKCSSCVLHLVREQAPDTPAVCSLPEFHLPETREYLTRTAGVDLVASGSDHNTGWSRNWTGPEDVPSDMRWIGAKGQVQRAYGRDETGVFLGLRAEESSRRRVHLRANGSLFLSQKDEMWHCSPIADWTALDVWAYLVGNGFDYNRAYDRLSEIGIPLARQRVGPLAVESVLGYGQLAILKRGWPDLYNRFVAQFPEARAFV